MGTVSTNNRRSEDHMILSKPKTLEEAWQLDDNDRISMADAIALCFRENDLEEGRAILANVKNMERARIKQREISGTVHQLLWLAIASVGANKAWTSGYHCGYMDLHIRPDIQIDPSRIQEPFRRNNIRRRRGHRCNATVDHNWPFSTIYRITKGAGRQPLEHY